MPGETPSSPPSGLDAVTLNFLNEDCARMMALYADAMNSIQSVFNFYLTFVSAVVGGVILIVQTDGSLLLLVGLLFFAALVGTVYLSALSGRYGRAERYAYAVDTIRRYLIEMQGVQVPPLYDSFMAGQQRAPQGPLAHVYLLFPTGTYALFIGSMNSLSLSIVTWLLLVLAGTTFGQALAAGLLVFVLTLSVANVYSHLVIDRFGARVDIYQWGDLPAWAAAR